MQRTALGALALAALTASALGACAPVQERHGYLAELDKDGKLPEVKAGVDTKATVLARLGTPSTTGAFDAEAWYYISSIQERFAFLTPDTSDRTIIAVRFGADDVVSKVETFGIERGKVVNYSEAKTPTRGRELGLIEQLFGTIGRGPTTLPGAEDESRRNRR
jgi:outer membrane protein assembly factor BamE (lipoprotein component of BamABCDE complex)